MRRPASQIREAIEENLPSDAEPSEYNWQALAAWFNARYGTNLKDKDLRKFAKFDGGRGRARPDRPSRSSSIEKAMRHDPRPSTSSPPASSSSRTGAAGPWPAGPTTSSAWRSTPPAGRSSPRPRSSGGSRTQARELYDRKEAEFPVRVGLTRFLAERSQGQQSPRYDRDGLAAWADRPASASTSTPRRSAPSSAPRSRPCCSTSPTAQYPGGKLAEELDRRLDDVYGPAEAASARSPDARAAAELAAWARDELGVEVTADELAGDRPGRGPPAR